MAGVHPDGGRHPLGSGIGERLASRPLKPGKSFTLVVHAPRVHHLGWDRADYSPGDACRLSIAGAKLGKAPLEVVVEELVEGTWVPREKVQAQVDAGQSSATVEWNVPVPAGHAEAVAARKEARRGKLLQAAWTRPELPEGEALVARVEAEGMEGAPLVLLFEKEHADGSWRGVAHAEAKVQGGACELAWRPPPARDAAAAAAAADAGPTARRGPVACAFADGLDLGDADTAWLKARCEGLEGQTVELVLEKEEGGGWSEVSNAVSTVRAGEARNGILLRK